MSVFVYDNYGDFVGEYPTIEQAAKAMGSDTFNASMGLEKNRHVCEHTGKSYSVTRSERANYIFLNSNAIDKERCKKRLPVYVFDLDGTLQNEYRDISEIRHDYGIPVSNIRQSLKKNSEGTGYYAISAGRYIFGPTGTIDIGRIRKRKKNVSEI